VRTGGKGASPTIGESQEDDSMAEDGDQQHPDIEGHERQHHQVIEAHAEGVKGRACQLSGCALPVRPDQVALAQKLETGGTSKDDDEGEDIVAGVGAGKVFEEDEGVLAPEEGHVRVRHGVIHVRHGCRRRGIHVHVHLKQSKQASKQRIDLWDLFVMK
jgi:hypothetical protein